MTCAKNSILFSKMAAMCGKKLGNLEIGKKT